MNELYILYLAELVRISFRSERNMAQSGLVQEINHGNLVNEVAEDIAIGLK